MDTRKKGLWRARQQGQEPNFIALTVESARWHPEPKRKPWVGELRRRARCLRRYRELAQDSPDRALARVCREFGIAERTLYRWQALQQQGGLAALIPASRRPEHSPRQTSAHLEWAILAIRLRIGWGVQRIAAELNALGLGPITHSAVYGVLERRAMKVPLVRRSKRAGCRYERDRPNDLWHMDLKGPLYFGVGMPALYGVAILDDYSRFCVGASFADNKRMDTALAALEEAVGTWGAPRQLMSDNGSEFVAIGTGIPSRFLRRLAQLNIEHLPIKLRTPETNGKIERFWLTLEWEVLERIRIDTLARARQVMGDYRQEYNFHRRHWALKYATPAQVYCPARASSPAPADLQALLPYLTSLKETTHNHD